MSKNHPPSPATSPPPLPGGHATPQHAQVNNQRPVPPARTPKKRNRLVWLWVLLLLMGGAGFLYWQYELAKFRLFGFQPPEMAMARYTPKDVIGDLGGLKVRIPRHYAEYVVYDGDPRFGEKRKGPVPERTFNSRLRNFGMKVRFPEMIGLENMSLREDYRKNFLNPDGTWLSLTINSGGNYPGLGANARNGRAKKLWTSSDYWAYNFERLEEDVYGLEMYVVKGLDPHTGQLARESSNTKDIYIERDASGHVHTYIECGRPSAPTGISPCSLEFGLEPEAEVAMDVHFHPKLLPQWKEIKQSVKELLLSFEVQDTTTNKP